MTGPDRTQKMQPAAHTWSGIPRLKSMASQVFEKNAGSVKEALEKAKKGSNYPKSKHVRLVADLFNGPITSPTCPPTSKDVAESKPRRIARDGPTVKSAGSTADLNRKSLPPVHIILPGVNAIAKVRRQPGTKELTAPDPRGQSDHRDTIHLRFPGLLRNHSGKLNKRDSLPLPPPPVEAETSSSSSSDSELQKQSPNATVALKPLPAVDLRLSRSGTSSVYSVDSAEQTWNMINSVMNAVSEEDVQKARASLNRVSAELPSKRASIVFPDGHIPGLLPRTSLERREGSEAPMRGRVESTSSVHNNSGLLELSAAKNSSQIKPTLDATKISGQVSRAKSTASVFSIVIKPFKSSDGLPPLVPEDRLPLRVKKIIQEQRERACFEAGLDAEDDEKEIAYHEDVAYALEALHDCVVLEDILEYAWDLDY